jgi:hypothetical protein
MQTTPCAQIRDEGEEEFGTRDFADLPKVNGAMREGRNVGKLRVRLAGWTNKNGRALARFHPYTHTAATRYAYAMVVFWKPEGSIA